MSDDSARPENARTIRVASVPANHVYVQHLTPVEGTDDVSRLPDPVPNEAGAVEGQWWPPTMLTVDWIRENTDDFDIFHVQFGFDAQEPRHLNSVVRELERLDKPLVYTVHDLRNPHHRSREAHDAHLAVLIPAAAALVTLTSGAADTIEQRWGRRPEVVPHPHVVGLERLRPRARRDDATFLVGIHAKSLRASMAPLPVLRALLPLVAELPELKLRANVHHDVFDRDGKRYDRQLSTFLSDVSRQGLVELFVHDCYSDEELWTYLEALDLSVLPYRFGTHSGWLEACFDLGTAVAAPSCGFYSQQRPCLTYPHDERRLDEESLRDAVRRAYRDRPRWQASPAERARERDAIAVAHRRIYEAVLG